jgi:hypothetical protein
MAIITRTGSGICHFSDVRRKGSRANLAFASAIKASKGNAIVLVHPLDQIMQRGILRKFLHAMHLMGFKKSPPGYDKYLGNIENAFKQAGAPVIVITNSMFTVPFWLIDLHSPRQFILVGSKSDGDPTPVVSESSNKASWRTFADRIKGLGVKNITLYGESSHDCVATACTGLFLYFKAGFDGAHVFPQEEPGLNYAFRSGSSVKSIFYFMPGSEQTAFKVAKSVRFTPKGYYPLRPAKQIK